LATPEIASEALFRQAGIIRVNTLEQLFDVATLLSNQPLPRGNRVAIVTNGGGPGILAADACDHRGLVVPDFSSETLNQLKSVIKREITVRNPLDMTAGASEEEFEGVLKVLSKDDRIHAVITIFVPPTVIDLTGIESAINRVSPAFQRQKKPILSCFIGQHGVGKMLGKRSKSVPRYLFPEDAVSALAKAVQYGEWTRKPKGNIPTIHGIRRGSARKIIEAAMTLSTQRPLWLSNMGIADLLDCYGIRYAKTQVAKTAGDAVALASKLEFPLAAKLCSSSIIHKTDVGGVRLDLNTEKDVEGAFNDIRGKLTEMGRADEMEGIILQQMVKGGIEAIVGVTQDPSFGALIMFGLGGIYAELTKDVAVRLHPLTDSDAKELVRSIKMSKLFEGYRGSPPSDTEAVEDLLLRLSALVEDIPQVVEMDLNPVKIMPKGEGYWVVDARIMLR
jgi:acetyltransferase